MQGASDKENPHCHTTGNSIKDHIMTFELAAVMLQSEFLAQSDQDRRCQSSMPGIVLGLATLTDLYHSHPMAFYVALMNEPDDFLAGEPTVCQYIGESYPLSYGSLYHFLGKLNFGGAVLVFPCTEHLAPMLRHMSPGSFLCRHTIVAIFTFLSEKGKIQQELGYPIGDSHTETFATKHRLVAQMGVDTPDFLYCAPCFLVVCIVKDETYFTCLMIGTLMNLAQSWMEICYMALRQFTSGLDINR